ncbi:MAG: hypothetical protein ABI268_13480 [Rhodanobacter sp.]
MRTRILAALVATALASTGVAAQSAPSPAGTIGMAPTAIPAPAPLAGALPPLPPGCVTAAPSPPRPPTMATSNVAFETALGLSAAQATQVRQVFEHQATQAQQLDQQHRALDVATCQQLRKIVGDQGLAKWWSSMPPHPPRGPQGPQGRPMPPPMPRGAAPNGPKIPAAAPPPVAQTPAA